MYVVKNKCLYNFKNAKGNVCYKLSLWIIFQWFRNAIQENFFSLIGMSNKNFCLSLFKEFAM